VVGVSESSGNIAKNILANLVNFEYQGKIYAVGPKGGEVFGHPVYESIMDLPGIPELAVILAPARFVPQILNQCGEKGTRWAIIESAGFQELGAEGEVIEREIVSVCKRYGIRFVGPNCIGTVNTANSLYTQFNRFPNPYRNGSVAVVAQSGGVGLSFAERLCTSGLGVSKIVTTGNKLSLDEVDYLDYFMDDPDTDVIYVYLEDFKRGRSFTDLALKCSKPIILHKSNTSSLSHTIAQSHTAALAIDDNVVDAVCSACGIIRVRSVSEALNAAKGLCLPMLKGNKLAVISRSGGQAVVAADACAMYGFQLPALGQDILDEARKRSRAGVIRFGNPLDLGNISHLSFFSSVVEKALCSADIDGVVFILVSQMTIEREVTQQLSKSLSALSLRLGKPVAVVMEIPLEERILMEKDLDFPFFFDPTEAVQSLAIQNQYRKCNKEITPAVDPDAEPLPAIDIKDWFRTIERENRQPLLHEAFDLLEITGVPTVPWRMARNQEEAVEVAESFGYPLALKAVALSLSHKSDKGGISLNVSDHKTLLREYQRLNSISNDISGIMVQKMLPQSREIIIGGKKDPSFGPVILVGFGGIMVEVIKDVQIRLAPIDTATALQMLTALSGANLLGRFRGMQAADLNAVARMMVKISLLMNDFPQIQEMDLNPVSLDNGGKGAPALDARILLTSDLNV